jgi:beta-lactamase superfamily II metal-dependent hydrolase
VGEGDTYYINHDSDNFTIIDCFLDDETKDRVLNEIASLSGKKGITRFISTHPDEDHIQGISALDKRINILNFYCVKNAATKSEESDDFKKYCSLRDSDKSFYIFKGCSRRWMNQGNDERKTSGLEILWPDQENDYFKEALKKADDGESPNNISPIIKYSLQDGATALWMGDLESDFMVLIENDLDLPKIDILFAPHHGRDTGKVPETLLNKMQPKLIVIGEAPSLHLNYYRSYNTLTQNSAGDIVFECIEGKVHIFTSKAYNVDFLRDEGGGLEGFYYIGTLNL